MFKLLNNEVKGFPLEFDLVFIIVDRKERRECFNFLCLLTESHLSQLHADILPLFRLLISLKVQEWARTAPPFHLITDKTYLSIRRNYFDFRTINRTGKAKVRACS